MPESITASSRYLIWPGAGAMRGCCWRRPVSTRGGRCVVVAAAAIGHGLGGGGECGQTRRWPLSSGQNESALWPLAARSPVNDAVQMSGHVAGGVATVTTPIDASSGDQIRHRLSRAENRWLNHVPYMGAVRAVAPRHRRTRVLTEVGSQPANPWKRCGARNGSPMLPVYSSSPPPAPAGSQSRGAPGSGISALKTAPL